MSLRNDSKIRKGEPAKGRSRRRRSITPRSFTNVRSLQKWSQRSGVNHSGKFENGTSSRSPVLSPLDTSEPAPTHVASTIKPDQGGLRAGHHLPNNISVAVGARAGQQDWGGGRSGKRDVRTPSSSTNRKSTARRKWRVTSDAKQHFLDAAAIPAGRRPQATRGAGVFFTARKVAGATGKQDSRGSSPSGPDGPSEPRGMGPARSRPWRRSLGRDRPKPHTNRMPDESNHGPR